MRKIGSKGLVLAVALTAGLSVAELVETPNVIVIMADDLGYGDVGCYGALNANVVTPNIDRLATEGVRFTSGYCANSTCTPSRYAMLTGQYAFRKNGTGIGGINGTLTIDENGTTLADMFKSSGYATAAIGKWHLGLGSGSAPDWNGVLSPGPLELGFDHCFLLPNTNDRVPSVYVEDHAVVNLDPSDPLTVSTSLLADSNPYSSYPTEDLKYTSSHGHNNSVHNGVGRIGYCSGGTAARWRDEDMADDFVNKALPWIEANTNTPFFLYFASQDCHVPRLPHERFQGQSALGWRGDAIVQVDWCVGQIIDKIEELGIAENTLILFCSDNGPVLDDGYNDDAVTKDNATGHAAAGPYRGGKYSVYEGGTRTPFITWWPGRIPTNTVSDEIVCSIDLARSFSRLTGQSVSGDAFPDSFDVLDALLGVDNARGRDHLIQADNKGTSLGFRQGNWKLVGTSALYNLDTDPGEQTNLASQYPQKLTDMLAWRNELIAADSSLDFTLMASGAEGAIELDWMDSTSTNFSSYTVSRSTTSGGPHSAIASNLTVSAYVDTNVVDETTYHYVVSTLYRDGTPPSDSNEASAMTIPVSTSLLNEAENAVIMGGTVKAVGSGWSGTGFVDLDEGGYVEFVVQSPGGAYDLEVQTAGVGDNLEIEVSVNETVIESELALPNTESWNAAWETTTISNVILVAGVNTIRLADTAADDQPQIDRLLLIEATDPASSAILIDYDDQIAGNGLHDADVRNGGFEIDTFWAATGTDPLQYGTNLNSPIGGRNAMVGVTSDGGTVLLGQDTGHVLALGDRFSGSFDWRDAWGWEVGETIDMRLFYTDDNTLAGVRTEVFTLNSGDETVDNTWETKVLSLTSALSDGGAVGKTLFFAFECNGAGVGSFARLDNIHLEVARASSESPVSDLAISGLASGKMVLSWVGVGGTSYKIETNGNLVAANWGTLTNGLFGDGELLTVTNAMSESNLFYRVIPE